MVEFCTTTQVLDEDTRRHALDLMMQATPEVSKAIPNIEFFDGLRAPDHAGVS